jgi:hypothetical protein
MRFKLTGGCHCGNLLLEIGLPKEPKTYAPRACDCDFCRKHGASYVSDPGGDVVIRLQEPRLLGRYRQGSGAAECLLCIRCGVLIGASYREGETLFATINSRAIDAGAQFGPETVVSPKLLGEAEKIGRWKSLWFPAVEIVTP